jgi:methyltransferase (TIGR00027 family)
MANILPPGIVQATAKLLVESGVVRSTTIRWAGSCRAVSVYEAFDWILPGQFEAFAYRKAFFERQVRETLDTDASQVLVLGAGYDTLTWRLAPEFPNVNFFEIDHPVTARLKAKGIKKMGQPDNLYLIAEDLGKHKLVDVIKSCKSWNLRARTVILAEGLVMYLPPEAVLSLFSQCAELVGTGSRFSFSYIPTGSNGRPDVGRWTGLMLWLQKAVGEPWTWSILPEELDSFLESSGWENAPELSQEPGVHGVELYAVAAKRPYS